MHQYRCYEVGMPMLIMFYIYWTTIILLYVLVCPVFSLTPTNMEIRESYLILNGEGTLKYTSKIPDCGSGGKIFLISYSYQQIQCDNDCYSVHEEPLLPTDVMLIHEMCSMKEKCQNLTFRERSEEQRNRINSVKITYRCVDHTSTSIDICKPCNVTFNDMLYLTAIDDSASLFKMCECLVNAGTFSIKAEDVRLNSIQKQNCTDAVVHINSKEFKCDAERGSFDAVFHRTVEISTSNVFISLILKSTTELPSMVLITVSPKRTGRLVCIPKPSRSGADTLSVARTTKPAVTYSVEEVMCTNSISHNDTESSSNINCERPVLAAFFASLGCVFVTNFSIICVMWRRLQSKKYNRSNENEIEPDGLQATVPLKGVSSEEEGSQYNSNEQDQTAGDNGKSILPSNPTIQMLLTTSVSYGPHSFQKSDIQHTPISACDTTSDTFICDSVGKTTLSKVPTDKELTEEVSIYDTDDGKETNIFFLVNRQ